MLEVVILNGAFVGSVVLMTLLIAMMATTYTKVVATAQLEVNYQRIVQSYSVSKDIWLIPPRLNMVVGVLLSIWLAVDLVVALCTANRKMVNDRVLSPLNRSCFVAGDLIEFRMGSGKQPRSGYVQYAHTAETAVVREGDVTRFVHKHDITAIHKSRFTDRLGSDSSASTVGGVGSRSLCAAILSPARFHCKYCRSLFYGDAVGDTEQIRLLFLDHGVRLDLDDTDKLRHQIGEDAPPSDKATSPHLRASRMRTVGVGQLCPQCFRPFYCSEDHCDEVQRLQYLTEVCSFWVFMLFLWTPLVIAFAGPALFSWIAGLIGFVKELF